MRYAVYPGKVASENNPFTQADMDREIGLMEAAAEAVEHMAKNGLFREAWNVLATSRALPPAQLPDEIKRSMDLMQGADMMEQPATARNEAIKLVGFFLYLAELYKAESEAPGKPEAAGSVPALPTPTPSAVPVAKPDFVPNADFAATTEQTDETIRLLNHPLITRREKTTHLLNLYKNNQVKAQAIIEKLHGWIDERENGGAQAA